MDTRRIITHVRGALVIGALGMVTVLGGCGGAGGGAAATTPTEAAATAAAAVHTRLAEALAEVNPRLSRQITAATSDLNEVSVPGMLQGWEVFEIVRIDNPHIPTSIVAIDGADRAVVLSGHPERFATLTEGGVQVDTPEAALDLVGFFLRTTRDTSRLVYPIATVDDLRWPTRLNADQTSIKEDAIARLREQIASPSTTETSSGWTITSWTGDQDTVVRHETTVSKDGAVTDAATTIAEGLPLQCALGG